MRTVDDRTYMCHNCGESDGLDADDFSTCATCGATICPGCTEYAEQGGAPLCPSCADAEIFMMLGLEFPLDLY